MRLCRPGSPGALPRSMRDFPRDAVFWVFTIVALGGLLGTMLLIALINEGALRWLAR